MVLGKETKQTNRKLLWEYRPWFTGFYKYRNNIKDNFVKDCQR